MNNIQIPPHFFIIIIIGSQPLSFLKKEAVTLKPQTLYVGYQQFVRASQVKDVTPTGNHRL